MIKGTDLSHWNTDVDYHAMKAADIRFACIKLGQGNLSKDIMFDTHTAGCDHVEVPWDPYWFADYRITGAANVAQLIAKAGGKYGRGHVVQDLEYYAPWGRPDGWHMKRFCLDFFAALEAQIGIVGLLYTNRDVLNQMWAAASGSEKIELARHYLWFASDTQTPAPTKLPIKLNQWEMDVYAPWAHGTVDYDEFLGPEEEFTVWKGGEPIPLTLEQRVDRLEELARQHGWIL